MLFYGFSFSFMRYYLPYKCCRGTVKSSYLKWVKCRKNAMQPQKVKWICFLIFGLMNMKCLYVLPGAILYSYKSHTHGSDPLKEKMLAPVSSNVVCVISQSIPPFFFFLVAYSWEKFRSKVHWLILRGPTESPLYLELQPIYLIVCSLKNGNKVQSTNHHLFLESWSNNGCLAFLRIPIVLFLNFIFCINFDS